MYLGAVGAYDWSGTVVKYDRSGDSTPDISSFDDVKEVLADRTKFSYLGECTLIKLFFVRFLYVCFYVFYVNIFKETFKLSHLSNSPPSPPFSNTFPNTCSHMHGEIKPASYLIPFIF